MHVPYGRSKALACLACTSYKLLVRLDLRTWEIQIFLLTLCTSHLNSSRIEQAASILNGSECLGFSLGHCTRLDSWHSSVQQVLRLTTWQHARQSSGYGTGDGVNIQYNRDRHKVENEHLCQSLIWALWLVTIAPGYKNLLMPWGNIQS